MTLGEYWAWERVGRMAARRDWDTDGGQHSRCDTDLAQVLSPLGYWEGYDSELSILTATDGGETER